MVEAVYTSGQVARLVGLPRHRLTYLIESELLPEPSLRVPGRRLFTAGDVNHIREMLSQQPHLRSNRGESGGEKEVKSQ
jgi:DNA-binding transcriptional MerR regulator